MYVRVMSPGDYTLIRQCTEMAHALSEHMRAPAVDSSCRHRRRQVANRRAIPKLAALAEQDVAVEVQVFNQLKQAAQVQGCLELRPTTSAGYGLFTSQPVTKGEVLMQVPRSLAIILDYEQGLQLPEGQWPRLQQGIARDPPLTWDLLLALALMDGLAGDGGQFWAAWCQAVLPAPETLCLPMCWSPERLKTLQHDATIQAAQQQQDRLKALFPTLSGPSGEVDKEPSCSWIAWAFACVRSRSFKFGNESFAIVPFLDIANHSASPNADFRMQGSYCEFFALQDIPAGQEVCITYSGETGYTNQRWMAQYGFVPETNTADRITFDLPAVSTTDGGQQGKQALETAQPNTVQAGNATAQAASATTSFQLSLAHMQDQMGDELFLDAISGKLPYSCAALRSLPWQPETFGNSTPVQIETSSHPAPLQHMGAAGSSSGAGSVDTAPDATTSQVTATLDSLHLNAAQELLRQCEIQLQACATSLQEDEEELAKKPPNARYVAALKYRMQRKRLLTTCIQLLRLYCGQGGASVA